MGGAKESGVDGGENGEGEEGGGEEKEEEKEWEKERERVRLLWESSAESVEPNGAKDPESRSNA